MSTPPTTPMRFWPIEAQVNRTNRYRTPAVVTPLLLSEGNDTTPEKSMPTTAPDAPIKEKRPMHTVEPSKAKKLDF